MAGYPSAFGSVQPAVAELLRLRSGQLSHPDWKTSSGGSDGDARSPISPFAPEASVPLPFQLGDHNFSSSVWKRNERERYRVRCVNEGYERLRNHLPLGDDKRISKVDTLRMAIHYIRHMERLLANSRHQRHCMCFQSFTLQPDKNLS